MSTYSICDHCKSQVDRNFRKVILKGIVGNSESKSVVEETNEHDFCTQKCFWAWAYAHAPMRIAEVSKEEKSW